MSLKVYIKQKPEEPFLSRLRENLHKSVEFVCSEKIPEPADYQILVSGLPDTDSLKASPNLKSLIIPWSGFPRATAELMRQFPDISIHNIHHNAPVVAEMAVTMMMALAKNLLAIDASLRINDWTPRYEYGGIKLLPGTKALIVGYGAIGREIAARCLALGMSVTAIRNSDSNTSDGEVSISPPSDLDKLLGDAQVLFLTLPLTDRTKEMFNARRLGLLPDGTILINVSRGRIIDEKALYETLKTGRIRAGLDVWYNYPDRDGPRDNTPPSQYPFNELANVIITPHLAGHCEDIEILRARHLADLVNHAARGGEMPNRIAPDRGY